MYKNVTMSKKIYILLFFVGALVCGYLLYQTIINIHQVEEDEYVNAILAVISSSALFLFFSIMIARQLIKGK